MAEHLVCCGGCTPNNMREASLYLDLHEHGRNVRLEIRDIGKRLLAPMPNELLDLLDIATYVYAADNALPRGSKRDSRLGARWRRPLHFLVPVRNLELWNSEPVRSALIDTLNFLADETYSFEFRPLAVPPPVERYLEFEDNADTRFSPDDVTLFSGGINSFAGAVELLAGQRRRVALVSHCSVNTMGSVQRNLVGELRRRLAPGQLLHIPIRAHLLEGLSREYTQRTRSFLFGALGFVTARLLGADRFSFFENGVVSLNLPPVDQVVGARATRTTHPQALRGFQNLFSALLGKRFSLAHPFVWLTKAEVIEQVAAYGFQDLLRYTRSCSRVQEMTTLHPHCGLCSQCIDRRFGMLAAGLAEQDPAEAYKVDLFTGARASGPDREMALSYVRMASTINTMTDLAFFSKYGEANRAVDFLDAPADEAASKIFGLYRRHAVGICDVVDREIAAQAGAIREGSLSPDCLISLIAGQSASGALYPASLAPIIARAESGKPIRIAIHGKSLKIVLEGIGELKGVSAAVVKALAVPFRQARGEELLPENYPFVKTKKLLKLLDIEEEETLRKRVHRCREQISKLVINAGRQPPDVNAVIESNNWHGYRLNPDTCRSLRFPRLSAEARWSAGFLKTSSASRTRREMSRHPDADHAFSIK